MLLNSLFKQPAFCFAKHPPPWYLDALSYLCTRVSSFPAGKGKGQAGMLICTHPSSPAWGGAEHRAPVLQLQQSTRGCAEAMPRHELFGGLRAPLREKVAQWHFGEGGRMGPCRSWCGETPVPAGTWSPPPGTLKIHFGSTSHPAGVSELALGRGRGPL